MTKDKMETNAEQEKVVSNILKRKVPISGQEEMGKNYA